MTVDELKSLYGFYTEKIEGFDNLQYKLNIQTIKKDESTLEERVLSSFAVPRNIILRGKFKAGSKSQLLANIDSLKSALSGVISLEWDGETVSCYLDGGIEFKEIGPYRSTIIAEGSISLREIGTADSNPAIWTLKLYRYDSAAGDWVYLRDLQILSGTLRDEFMGRQELDIVVEHQDIQNLDEIRVSDGVRERRYIVHIPEPTRRDAAKTMRVVAEHRGYRLINQFFREDATGEEIVEYESIDLSTLLSYLFAGTDFTYDTANLNATTLSSQKNISFNRVTKLQALQQICEKWEIEYKFSADGSTVYLGEKNSLGNITSAIIEYSKNLSGISKKIDSRTLITRLYPIGGSQNLPDEYVYQNLRITVFDRTADPRHSIRTGASGLLYIEKNTDIYGVIEGIKEFPDIYPRAKHGTVEVAGTETYGDFGLCGYIQDSSRTETSDEISGGTIYVRDGAKTGEARIYACDAVSKKVYFNSGQLGFTPSVGATYKILNVELTDAEINAASQELLDKALSYLDTVCDPKVSYQIDFAQLWERDKISYNSDYFEAGDFITIRDTDLGIDEQLRVLSKQVDLVRPWNVRIEVSNQEKRLVDFVVERIEEEKKIKVDTQRLTIDQRTANNAMRMLQILKNKNFFGEDIEFDGGNIRAGTIEAEAIAIGSGNRNFQLWNVELEANHNGDYAQFYASVGGLTFYGDDANVWQLYSNTYTSLVPDTTYYVYIRLTKGNLTATTNQVILSNARLSAEDSTYYYYHIGYLKVGNASTPSKLAVSYGFTLINGQWIQAGTVTAQQIEAALRLRAGQQVLIGPDGSEVVKMGYGVLSDEGDGILVNGANIEVIGQIDTDYLDLQKAVTVKPGSFVSAGNADSLFPSSITINNTYTVEKTINFIVPVSIATAKGAKNYYKYPLFKLSYAWNVDYGDFGGGYPGYAHGGDLTFEIIVDGVTVFSESQTDVWFRYYQNGNSQTLDFYQILANNGITPRANLPITFKFTIDDYKKDDFAPDTVDNNSSGSHPSYLSMSVWDVYPTLPVL
ncbi:MAG: phage tail spike protein [Candidatus Thorarchaeota archaeon]